MTKEEPQSRIKQLTRIHSWFAIAISVIGFAVAFINMSIGGEKTWTVIGYAVAFFGVFLAICRWDQALTKVSNEVLQLSTSADEVKRFVQHDTAVLSAMNMTVTTGTSHGNEHEIIARMSRRLICTLFVKYYNDLSSFHNDVNHALSFNASYLAYRSLFELLNSLTDGSIWFGISRVTGNVWATDELQIFLTNAREKSKKRKIVMRRLYALSKHAKIPDETLGLEREAGIKLKRINLENVVEHEPKDISLAWRYIGDSSLIEGKVPKLPEDVDEAIRDTERYEPVGALLFDVDKHTSLVSLAVVSGKSPVFATYVDQFKVLWQKAQTL